MPKVDDVQIQSAASKVYDHLMATLGLKAARKAQLIVGRMLLEEKKRRDKLDGR